MYLRNLIALLLPIPLLIACGDGASDSADVCEDVSCLPHSSTCNELSWQKTGSVEVALGSVPFTAGGTIVDGVYDVVRMNVRGSVPSGATIYGAYEFKGSQVAAYVGARNAAGVLTSFSATGLWSEPSAGTRHIAWVCSNDPSTQSEDYAVDVKDPNLTLVPLDDDTVQVVSLVRRAP